MAVGLRLKFDGGTKEQYDAIHSQMDVDGDPPEGLIFHSAGPIEGFFVETAIIAGPALGVALWLGRSGHAAFLSNTYDTLMLIGTKGTRLPSSPEMAVSRSW